LNGITHIFGNTEIPKILKKPENPVKILKIFRKIFKKNFGTFFFLIKIIFGIESRKIPENTEKYRKKPQRILKILKTNSQKKIFQSFCKKNFHKIQLLRKFGMFGTNTKIFGIIELKYWNFFGIQ
jgi:hypothetical protein